MKQITKPRSWVIYGRAGTGKTTLASTFPGPILLVDVKDEGTDSVSDVRGLDVLEVETWQDLEDLYWHLKENPKGYKTVILDTITNAQTLKVEEVAGGKAERAGKNAGDWGVMTKQDWGTVAGAMKKLITDYRGLDMEVVFLAQDRTFNLADEEDESGALDPEVGPRLSPSVVSHLCAAVHMVGHTFIREKTRVRKVKGKDVETKSKEYCIRLGPNSYYITKLRKPKDIDLPDFLSNPTYEDILEIVKGD